MTYTVGDKTAAFTGRDPFPVDDEAFKAALLATGVFTDVGSGDLVYSGNVAVKMNDGSERLIDARGFLAVALADLADPTTTSFR